LGFFILIFSTQIINAATINWVGSTSTSWNIGSNWSAGAVPTASDNVQIGVVSFSGNQPTISASASCSSLTISNVTASTLTVNAPLSVTNTITVTSGTINSNASGTITAANVNLSTSTFTLNGTLAVSGTLQTPTSPGGNSTLTTNATGNTITGGISVHTGSNLTWSGSGTTACGASTVFSTTTLTIGTGNTINFSGTLTINSGSTPGLLINNGNLAFTSSSISIASPSSLTTVVTNNSGATISLTTSGNIGLGATAGLENAGTITANAGTSLTSGNGSLYTNDSGGTITLTGATFNLVGGANLNNTGNINLSSSSTLTSGNPVVITNNNGGSLTFTASTLNMQSGSHIINSGSVSALSGSTVTIPNTTYINNSTPTGSLTVSGSNVNIGGGGSIINSGTVTTNTSSAINLSGNPATIVNNVNGLFNATSTTFTLAAGSSITNTGGAINATSSTFTLNGNPSSITNQNITITGITTVGTASFDACQMTFNGSNSLTNSGALTINDGSSIILSSSSTSCSIKNSGTFSAGTSNSSCTITLNNQGAISNSSKFYLGSTSVIQYLTSASSNCSITNSSGATFTLQSDQYGSATIANIPQSHSNTLTGIFNAERYITGSRGYRIFSSQVNAGAVGSNNVISLNYLQNSILVLGTTGTTRGFDKQGNPTIYIFRENLSPLYTSYLNSNWQGINDISKGTTYGTDDVVAANQSINIPVANGYLVFFRGDRNAFATTALALANETVPTYSATPTTVTASGTMNVGTVQAKLWYTPTATLLGYSTAANPVTTGLNCIGNPYSSAIDWDTFSSTSSSAAIYGPGLSGAISFLSLNGSYATYSVVTHTGNNGATHIIPSGVGFFVQASSSSPATPTLTFTENAKINTQAALVSTFMDKSPVQLAVNNQYLRIQMALDSFYNEDVLINFNKNTKATYDINEDAPYLLGTNKVNLNSISSDNVPLAINQLPLPTKSQAVGLNVGADADGIYTLNMKQIVSIPQLFDIWLMDAYKKDSLDMRHNPTYAFNIYKSDTNSYGAGRFTLVIRQNPAYAYRLLNFTATKAAARQVQLAWETENEQNYTYFTVERSTDGGKTFNVLGGPASTGAGRYTQVDKDPAEQNLYRLKQQDINDKITYSNIVPISYANLSNNLGSINLYPNPASSTINLSVTTAINTSGSYNIKIINSTGLIVKQATSAQINWQTSVSDLLPGTYIVRVFNTSDNALIGDTKFVKR
jgi:trimeric autotransporter adhesin